MEENKKINFQEELKRLDDIVNSISSKSISLDESMKLYAEGHKIIESLEKALKEAEEKVESIVNIK